MNFGVFDLLFGITTTSIGCVIGVLGYKKSQKKDNDDKVKHDTTIDIKLDNIAKNVDEIRLDNKDFSKSMTSLSERVTKVEESTKQAHKRIDNLEELHLQK